jgi:hypothetical protein
VSNEHCARARVRDRGQRVQVTLSIHGRCGRNDSRSAPSGVRIERDDSIARDDRVARWQMECTMAVRMPRSGYDLRFSWYRESHCRSGQPRAPESATMRDAG